MTAKYLFLLLIGVSLALPAKDEQMILSPEGNEAIVESKIREVRAIPKNVKDLLASGAKGAYLHTYDDGEGEAQGYHKKTEENGSKGYKHFDSYHKKDSDKYGYEKHEDLGSRGKGSEEVGGYSEHYKDENKKNDEIENENYKNEEEDDEEKENVKENERYENADDNENYEDAEETKNTYKVVEEVDEDGEGYTGGSDGGSSESYTNADNESENYNLGDENGYYNDDSSENNSESQRYTNNEDGDEDSDHYSEDYDY